MMTLFRVQSRFASVALAFLVAGPFVVAESESGRMDYNPGQASGNEAARRFGRDTNATKGNAAESAPAEFLRKLHAIDLAETRVGHLAETRGNAEAVKRYGKMLIADHGRSQQRVERLAKEKNILLNPVPPSKGLGDLEGKLDTMRSRLTNVPSKEFDRAFAREMVDGHDAAIQMVKTAKKSLGNAGPYRELADATLPVLEKHRNMARDLLSSGNRRLGE